MRIHIPFDLQSSILLAIKNNKLHGFLGTIINELKAALNFTVEVVSVEVEYGIYNTTTERWGGAIGVVIAETADIGIADFSLINDRPDYVDFTIPILTTRQMLFLKQPEIFAAKWLAYYKVNTPRSTNDRSLNFSSTTVIRFLGIVCRRLSVFHCGLVSL